ncbi:hypothetical protein HGRIS_006039 [Hohenbuehelia grisea]|uniref:F-box domain-containing protein n=1 Tax=Hohenbuehelia grisea TaxID=104357 RepID=A0ABR3K057_9AGAR
MPAITSHEKTLETDIKDRLAAIMSANKSISAEDAMKQVQQQLLQNNPFVPPTGTRCPINGLPTELLAHIFHVGTYELDEDEEDEFDEEDYEDETVDLRDGWETESEGASESELPGDVEIIDLPADDVAMETGSNHSGSNSSFISFEAERHLPFQVLVSHVCRRWREASVSTPTLWTRITFSEPPFEQSRVWIERSGTAPLDIEIDCTRRNFIPDGDDDLHVELGSATVQTHPTSNSGPHDLLVIDSDTGMEVDATVISSHGPIVVEAEEAEDSDTSSEGSDSTAPPFFTPEDITTILDLVCPHFERWKSFSVEVNEYENVHTILGRLSALPHAPLLEGFHLHHYELEDLESEATFIPPELRLPFFVPFCGQTPKLKNLALWGVHLAWADDLVDQALSPIPPIIFKSATQLTELELAYHVSDVRPSFDAFAAILNGAPRLESLGLVASGPSGSPSDWVSPENPVLPSIPLPTLRKLSLYYQWPEYAIGLLRVLDVPNLKCLRLDFDSEDYFEFVQELCGENKRYIGLMPPRRGQGSILDGLQELKIAELTCGRRVVETMLSHLGCLEIFDINCTGDAVEFFERLMKPVVLSTSSGPSSASSSTMYCPSLTTIRTYGVSGSKMREMVLARKAGGVPLKRVMISKADEVSPKEEEWLRENLELGLEYYSASEEDSDFDDELDDDLGIEVDMDGDSDEDSD